METLQGREEGGSEDETNAPFPLLELLHYWNMCDLYHSWRELREFIYVAITIRRIQTYTIIMGLIFVMFVTVYWPPALQAFRDRAALIQSLLQLLSITGLRPRGSNGCLATPIFHLSELNNNVLVSMLFHLPWALAWLFVQKSHHVSRDWGQFLAGPVSKNALDKFKIETEQNGWNTTHPRTLIKILIWCRASLF